MEGLVVVGEYAGGEGLVRELVERGLGAREGVMVVENKYYRAEVRVATLLLPAASASAAVSSGGNNGASALSPGISVSNSLISKSSAQNSAVPAGATAVASAASTASASDSSGSSTSNSSISNLPASASASAAGGVSLAVESSSKNSDTSKAAGIIEKKIVEKLSSAQAVVLVYDHVRAKGRARELVKEWDAWMAHCGTAEAKLCVAKTTSNEADSAIMEWCIDQGFEWISVESMESQIEVKREKGEEKTGVPRILEALSVVMWNGMERKDPSRAATAAASTSSAASSAVMTKKEKEVAPAKKESKKKGKKSKKSKEEDLEMFEKMLEEAGNMKKQLKSLPDDKRRQKAAEMVIQFMEQLGFEESDNSDDEKS